MMCTSRPSPRARLAASLLALALGGCSAPPTTTGSPPVAPASPVTPATPMAPPPADLASPSGSGSPSPSASLVGAQQADLQIPATVYRPGDEIKVLVLGTGLGPDAWIALVPSTMSRGEAEAHRSQNLQDVSVDGAQTVWLAAPRQSGGYDLRLFPGKKGGELAARSFSVSDDPQPVAKGSITWKPTAPVAPGQRLEIPFEAPLGWSDDAGLAIVPAATPRGQALQDDDQTLGFAELEGRSRGQARLSAPTAPGSYEVRLYDREEGGKEHHAVPFEVRATP